MTLKTTELTLSSTFELKGEWWPASNPSERVGGTLKFTPTSIKLELQGVFRTEAIEDKSKDDPDWVMFPLIYGATDGGDCTLVNVTTHKIVRIIAKNNSTYFVRYLVLDAHVTDETIPTTETRFSCQYLDTFAPEENFSFQRDESGVLLGYKTPTPYQFDILSGGTKLSLEQKLKWSGSDREYRFSARNYLTIQPESPRHFVEWYVPMIWKLCDLLKLLTDERAHPVRVEIRLQQEMKTDFRAVFWAVGVTESESESPESLFYFATVEHRFGEILDRWLTASPIMESAIHLFIGAMKRTGSGSVEGRFLALSQSFEAWHRATSHASYMQKDDYERVRATIANAIPKEVGSDHRQSLKKKIEHGNEHSLRKRLKDSLRLLSPNAVGCVCKSVSNFADGVVESRNYLTHYTDDLRTTTLSGSELHWAAERMAVLMRILLLKWLCIEEELIVERIYDHYSLFETIWYARRFPEKIGEKADSPS